MQTHQQLVEKLLDTICHLDYQGEKYLDSNIDNQLPAKLKKAVDKALSHDALAGLPDESFQTRSFYVPEGKMNPIEVIHTFGVLKCGQNIELVKIKGCLNRISWEKTITAQEKIITPLELAIQLDSLHKEQRIIDITHKELDFLNRSGFQLSDFSGYYWHGQLEKELSRVARLIVYMPEEQKVFAPIVLKNHAGIEKGVPAIDFFYAWHNDKEQLALQEVFVSINQEKPHIIAVTGNESLWTGDFQRAVDFLLFKQTVASIVENEGYNGSIKEVIGTLQLQGFVPHSFPGDKEGKELETELFRYVKNITNDSSATGTHALHIPFDHHFHDGQQMPLIFSFLYNKESGHLNVHSIQATCGGIQERFLPDDQKILPSPYILRSFLEHKAATQRALKLLQHKPGKKALSHK
jgi:hypothetical protein